MDVRVEECAAHFLLPASCSTVVGRSETSRRRAVAAASRDLVRAARSLRSSRRSFDTAGPWPMAASRASKRRRLWRAAALKIRKCGSFIGCPFSPPRYRCRLWTEGSEEESKDDRTNKTSGRAGCPERGGQRYDDTSVWHLHLGVRSMETVDIPEIRMTNGEVIRVQGGLTETEKELSDAARSGSSSLAWLVTEGSGERIGINPHHVVSLRLGKGHD